MRKKGKKKIKTTSQSDDAVASSNNEPTKVTQATPAHTRSKKSSNKEVSDSAKSTRTAAQVKKSTSILHITPTEETKVKDSKMEEDDGPITGQSKNVDSQSQTQPQVQQPSLLKCPYCSHAVSEIQLADHVFRFHPQSPALPKVVCPICAAKPGGDPNYYSRNFHGHLEITHLPPGSNVHGKQKQTATFSSMQQHLSSYEQQLQAQLRLQQQQLMQQQHPEQIQFQLHIQQLQKQQLQQQLLQQRGATALGADAVIVQEPVRARLGFGLPPRQRGQDHKDLGEVLWDFVLNLDNNSNDCQQKLEKLACDSCGALFEDADAHAILPCHHLFHSACVKNEASPRCPFKCDLLAAMAIDQEEDRHANTTKLGDQPRKGKRKRGKNCGKK